ncbi:MAG TPA: ATP/GTP-binding protein [Methanofastidiosum sp.]|nr:ATP/GTP-binding protein [Methanofastidiosum sp.]HOC77763.1 ATP/GTP-binding protein [Methanofastidiosum sp.]HPA49139.1 ATP/GTP-binding protein [Methanofastidiosum sp.]HQK62452.1 ATP/GTP-binding protein [Methanofastidiosum sp.]HQM94598.1 ATP/GTP-binding protein [Methanofastidiosum sp.]
MRYAKIIITGPFNSGKTELVKTLSDIKVVETEEKLGNEKISNKTNTTVVMDFGRTSLNDNIIYLYGTPGQERFDFMWEILSNNMLGFIVMIDSTKRDFSSAKNILKFFINKAKVPYIIVANKQDLPGALDKENVRKLLDISNDIEIVECIATDPKSSLQVLKKIMDKISS